MENKIRIIKNDDNDNIVSQDFDLIKELDLTHQDPVLNISFLNDNFNMNSNVKIPIIIWKYAKTKNDNWNEYKKGNIEDKESLFCVGSGINVFTCVDGYIYKRNVSLDTEKTCKGSIHYCKQKDCAILELNMN